MKNRFIILVLLGGGLLVLGLLVWGWQLRSRPPVHQPPSGAAGSPSTATNPSTDLNQPVAPSAEWVRPADVDETGWKYMTTVRDQILQSNQPVEFYARVLDQHGQPVSGAMLDLTLTYVDEAKVRSPEFIRMKLGSEIASKPIHLESDHQGWFRLTGEKGKILSIVGLSKPGHLSNFPPGTFDSLMFDPGGKRRGSVRVEILDALDPHKGYTFHLWRKGISELVVPITIGVDMNQLVNNQWVSNYFIRFCPARVEWTNFAGVDLNIQGIRRMSGNPDRPYEFSFTLVVPNGGIALADDAYPYQAPTTGYLSSWSFENRPQTNPPDFPWTKTAYFRLRDGKAYAGVRLGFCNGGFDFSFTGYLNPSGSRNLEPDPEKLITDPEEIKKIDERLSP